MKRELQLVISNRIRCLCLCLGTSLFFPTLYTGERLAFYILFILISLVICKNHYLDKKILEYWIITFVVSLLSILHGYINGNPGAIAVVPLYLIYPSIFLYIIACVFRHDSIRAIHLTICYTGALLSLVNIVMTSNEFFIHNSFINSLSDFFNYSYGFEIGAVSFSSHLMDSACYIFAYNLSCYLLGLDTYDRSNKLVVIISMFLSLCVVLVGQSRMQWLLAIVTPVIIVLFCKKANLKTSLFSRRNLAIITFLVIAMMYAIISIFEFDLLYEKLLSSFDFSTDDSNLERTLQFKALTRDFFSSPIIGHGQGHVSSYLRNFEMPWSYEMIYNYLLAADGILGFSIYVIATIWIFAKSFRIAKRSPIYAHYLIPQIVGLMVIILASESNPYLLKFDFLWMLFLPLLTINSYSYDIKRCR